MWTHASKFELHLQAKKRSASDCRARFLMLMRARQAAAAQQTIQHPPTAPLPHTIRDPNPAAVSSLASGSSAAAFTNPAAARPAALPATVHLGQGIPTASLHLAAALAHQPHPALPASFGAVTTAAQSPFPSAATASPSVPTAGAGLASVVPQLSQLQSSSQLLRPQGTHLGLPEPSAYAAQQQAQSRLSIAMSTQQPSAVYLSSMPPPSAAVAAPVRPVSGLASLLAGQPAAPATAVTETTALPGGGRGLRLVHKTSLDVLRLKLRLVDLVQGCPALCPKVSNTHVGWRHCMCIC